MSPHRKQASQDGAGPPTVTPEYVGQNYFDTTNDILYASNGTASSANWLQIQNFIAGGTGLRKVTEYVVESPSVWSPSTVYAVDDEVIPLTGYTRLKYVCTSGGTSGSSEPSWDTAEGGGSTSDNTVSWNTEVDGEDEVGFIGLDINSHDVYVINVEIHNNYVGNGYDSWVNMFVNADENASNYKYRAGNVKAEAAYVTHSAYGEHGFAIIHLKRLLDDNSVATAGTQNYRSEIRDIGWWHEQSSDTNITSLKFSASTPGFNIFGVESRFIIYGFK